MEALGNVAQLADCPKDLSRISLRPLLVDFTVVEHRLGDAFVPLLKSKSSFLFLTASAHLLLFVQVLVFVGTSVILMSLSTAEYPLSIY